MTTTLDATTLVCFFDAAVRDDAVLMRVLTQRHPHMASLDHPPVDTPYTNHFYLTPRQNDPDMYMLGIIVEDTARARAVARECKIEEYIYWGANTDPVSIISAAKIVEIMATRTWTWMHGNGGKGHVSWCKPDKCYAYLCLHPGTEVCTQEASTKRSAEDATDESKIVKKVKSTSQPAYDLDTIHATFVDFMRKKIVDEQVPMIGEDVMRFLLIGSGSDKSYMSCASDPNKEEALLIVAKAMFPGSSSTTDSLPTVAE